MSELPEWQPCLRRDWQTLNGQIQTEVAVVGGGLTGVTTALMLSALGVHVVLLEKDRLGCGASWGCLGALDIAPSGLLHHIERTAGKPITQTYAAAMSESAQGVLDLIRRLGLNVQLTASAQGHTLSPMVYLHGMADAAAGFGCAIYEHSPVRQIIGHRLITPYGSVTASTILLATGIPIGCKRLIPLALCKQRVLAFRHLVGSLPTPDAYASHPKCLRLREIPGGLLAACDIGLAGSRHQKRLTALEKDLKVHFPAMRVVQSGYRQEVFSADGLPVIGPIRRDQRHLLMATGFSGFGLAGSFLAAKILSGQLLARPDQKAQAYRPDRSYPGHTLPVFCGALRVAAGYARGLAHPFAPVCPHMGCRLRYSRVTQRWECPCHGSAYELTGRLEQSPSMTDALVSLRQRPK